MKKRINVLASVAGACMAGSACGHDGFAIVAGTEHQVAHLVVPHRLAALLRGQRGEQGEGLVVFLYQHTAARVCTTASAGILAAAARTLQSPANALLTRILQICQ
ncbi:hypothetical protein GJV26_23720 [Massilia dura]|uniref:Lipoprotein n=1 Tax=Pseudoduganella dura TaxID=321982 RepID=A0A6I3XLN6_9BURK|nr:hypothetical protein [Pseudoduganella dura]MUI15440.1 hypothetical protein [Pseudoduganella dura]GGX79907.1 hypothetical protein GCM10007386_08510 [Pseudoduganella dura]